MKVGVVGHRGRLGSELIRQGAIAIECDVTDVKSVEAALKGRRLASLVNCAAYTAVDEAETEAGAKKAFDINYWGVVNLRRCFKGHFIHISTGYIFDGEHGYYTEDWPIEKINPLSVYAHSKWGGEIAAVLREPTTIIRTLDLFGENTPIDFVKVVLKKLEAGESFSMPDNLYGNPTYIPALATTIFWRTSWQFKNYNKVLHIAGSTILSRYEFAVMIAEVWDYDAKLISPTKEIKGAATRPLNASLDTTLAANSGFTILTALEGLLEMKKAMEAAPNETNTESEETD